MKIFYACSLLLIFTAGCGLHIEKRHYNKGFHVHFNSKKSTDQKSEQKNTPEQQLIASAGEQTEVKRSFAADQPNDDNLSKKPIFIDEIVTPQPRALTAQVYSESENPPVLKSEKKQHHTASRIESKNKQGKSSTSGDHWLYLISGFIGIAAFGTAYALPRKTMRVSRWASKNKYTSKGLIALSQFGLAYLGYSVGTELSELGYSVSNATQYVASGVGGTVFLGTLVAERWGFSVFNMRSFFLKKAAHTVIGASLFACALGAGNGLQQDATFKAPMVHLVEYTASSNAAGYEIPKQETIAPQSEPRTSSSSTIALIVLYVFLAILLTFGLFILSCAAICAFGTVGALVILPCLAILILFNIRMSQRVIKSKAMAKEMQLQD